MTFNKAARDSSQEAHSERGGVGTPRAPNLRMALAERAGKELLACRLCLPLSRVAVATVCLLRSIRAQTLERAKVENPAVS